jgi:hypothetical protein
MVANAGNSVKTNYVTVDVDITCIARAITRTISGKAEAKRGDHSSEVNWDEVNWDKDIDSCQAGGVNASDTVIDEGQDRNANASPEG